MSIKKNKSGAIPAAEYFEKHYGPMTLGRFIKGEREFGGISQTKLASKLKISRANLCDIEKNRKLVSPERAAKFAKVMKMPETLFITLALQDLLREAKLKYKVKLIAK